MGYRKADASRLGCSGVGAQFGNIQVEGIIFERGIHVTVIGLGYLKPPDDSFNSDLSNEDGRSAKKWEFLNYEGVWI